MEKYSKHLESLVAERTQDLVAEKAKTDRLLYSMFIVNSYLPTTIEFLVFMLLPSYVLKKPTEIRLSDATRKAFIRRSPIQKKDSKTTRPHNI